MTAPTDSLTPTWPTCQAADGCHGVRVGGDDACLAHLDESKLIDWLATLEPGSDLDLRGTHVGDEHLVRLLTAFRNEHGHTHLGIARFDGAQFIGTAHLSEVQFSGSAWFDGAQFGDTAWFDGAQFSDTASFDRAQFAGDAWFDGAQFSHRASFDRAQFAGAARFGGAQFSDAAWFSEAHFSSFAWFEDAQFDDGWFNGAQFSDSAWYSEARFSGGADFREAQFQHKASLGPLQATSSLILDRATFQQAVLIEVTTRLVSCVDTQFAGTAAARVRHADVVLDGAVFAKPSTFSCAPDPFAPPSLRPIWTDRVDTLRNLFDETLLGEGWREAVPRLLSVRRVDVSTLVLNNIDLEGCLFSGAHNIDKLRIEGPSRFADTPRGWKFVRIGLWDVPIFRWTRRQTLAEEHNWRAEQSFLNAAGQRPHSRQHGWATVSGRVAGVMERTGERVQPLSADHLASLYRALRKAQEDSKNEPGAADFYYGEMEMRRLAPTTPWGERVILTLYWLVAGYGLRGLRALTALAVVVVALTGLFHAVGFVPTHPAPSWWDSLLYTAGSTLSINDDALKLTAWGKLLRILLRVLGPLLLGLALLSVRNRVKR